VDERDWAALASMLAGLAAGLPALLVPYAFPWALSSVPGLAVYVMTPGGYEVVCYVGLPLLLEAAAVLLGMIGVAYFYGLRPALLLSLSTYAAASALDLAFHALLATGQVPPEALSASIVMWGAWWNLPALSAMLTGTCLGLLLRGDI